MAKKPSAEDALKEIVAERKEKEKEALNALKGTFDNECYTVYEDPNKLGRHFLIAKIKFNTITKEAMLEEIVDLDQKVIGVRYPEDQKSIKHYYDQKIKEKKSN